MTTKSERQAATARMKKCACGNVAKAGGIRCGRCADAGERAENRADALLTAIESLIMEKIAYDRRSREDPEWCTEAHVDGAREDLRKLLIGVCNG